MTIDQAKLGYAVTRFLARPPLSLLCVLCEQVVRRPVECAHCGVLYCGLCSTTLWAFNRQKNNRCPACSQLSHFKPVTRALKSVIGKLELRCKHDFCGQILALREVEQHERQCSCKPVRCHWCGQVGIFGEFSANLARATQDSSVVCSQQCAVLSLFRRTVKSGRAKEALSQYWLVLKRLEDSCTLAASEVS